MLINGAQDVAGQYVASEAGSIPNNAEGFGRVDMAATFSAAVQLRDEATALDTGDEETTTVTVTAGASLKVTLVWTDRPGATLQNDLDLIVRRRTARNVMATLPLTQRLSIATIMSSKSSGKTCPPGMCKLSCARTASHCSRSLTR